MLALAIIVSSCNKKLSTVLVEDPAGNVELIYAGSQMPENLVKEVRYFPNGDTLSVTPMLKSAVHGVVTAYHKGNLKKEEVTFQHGVQDGSFRKYDKEGVLVFEGNMKNGRKNGVWTTWYDEVQISEQRNYVDNQPEGTWSYWYIDGSLKREEVYKLGKLIEEKSFN
jgi:antitoxin component YwqK of YwqJK toxin-antitoxin module